VDRKSFWNLIDKSRRAAEGDAEEQLDFLREELLKLSADAVVRFDEIMADCHIRSYSWPLWGAAYIIGGGCSDDGFDYFRGWLISRGEKTFEAAVQDPDSLARVVKVDEAPCEAEGYEFLAQEVWEELTHKPSSEFPCARRPGEPSGTRWSEDQLDVLFPKLAKKFG